MAKQPKSRNSPNGRLSYKPPPDDGLVPKTLAFVRIQLSVWRDDPVRPSGSSEKLLNSSLCDFLDSRARSAFPMVRFKHEAPQAELRTVDLGVHGIEETTLIGAQGYTIYEPFLVIEAKRLPAPSNDREREYVAGTHKASGGIQRFKLGLHGANVETAIIVGYVEKESLQHWRETINRWVSDLVGRPSSNGCVWNLSDTLGQLLCDDEKGTSAVESIHQRSAQCVTASIKIHHFWILMHSESQ